VNLPEVHILQQVLIGEQVKLSIGRYLGNFWYKLERKSNFQDAYEML
jgi:hypothetical protein